MTTQERQQSLINARRAADLLDKYLDHAWGRLQDSPQRQAEYPSNEDLLCIAYLLFEFHRLDDKEQRQIKSGKLGGAHGKKGGRPKGSTKARK